MRHKHTLEYNIAPVGRLARETILVLLATIPTFMLLLNHLISWILLFFGLANPLEYSML